MPCTGIQMSLRIQITIIEKQIVLWCYENGRCHYKANSEVTLELHMGDGAFCCLPGPEWMLHGDDFILEF